MSKFAPQLQAMSEEFIKAAQADICTELGVADIEAARRQWDMLQKHARASYRGEDKPWQLKADALSETVRTLTNAIGEARFRWLDAPGQTITSIYCPVRLHALISRALLACLGLASEPRAYDPYNKSLLTLEITGFVNDEWEAKAFQDAPAYFFRARVFAKKEERKQLVKKVEDAKLFLATADERLRVIDEELAGDQASLDKKTAEEEDAAAAKSPKRSRKQ